MTDTTTKDHVETENLVDAAARAAAEAASKTLATLEPEQTKFTEHQVAILRQIGLEDATQGDLDLFFHVCRTTGLDPFRKQIYMIGRNTKVVEWVDNASGEGRRKVEKYVTKYTIQTGIDGYRRNVREIAKAYGDHLAFDGPYFCGEDGEWREVWPAKTPPTAAKFTVFRNGEPHTGIAHYDEFVQTNAVYEGSGQNRKKVGESANSMWDKMPRNQTAKCAEALSYRRAYPDDFSGLILEDSAQPTVIDQDGNIESAPPKQRPAARDGGLRGRARAAEQQEPMDVETVEPEATHVTQQETRDGVSDTDEVDTQDENTPTADPAPGPKQQKVTQKRQKLNAAMFRYLGAVELNGDDNGIRKDRLIVLTRLAGRDELITSSNDLTDDEVQEINKTFDAVGDHAAANDMVTSVLNAWVAAHSTDGNAAQAEPTQETLS